MPRRNPPLPPAPPKRRFQGAPVTTQRDRNALARVRSMANSLDERDRPFSPERPGTWRGSSKDLVVNRRLRRNSHLVVLTDDDFEALSDAQKKDWGGYTYKMTYETWAPEDVEIGDTDDRGWEEEGSEPYESLKDVLRAAQGHSWVEWSSSNIHPGSWLISEDYEGHRTGERTIYNLWIERVDKQPLSDDEIDFINKTYGISNFGRMRRNAHPDGRGMTTNPRTYEARLVHKISPRDTDRKTVTLSDSAFSSKTALAEALRRSGALSKGQRLRDFRVEGDRVVAFPEGGIWHSIIIDMGSAGEYTRNGDVPAHLRPAEINELPEHNGQDIGYSQGYRSKLEPGWYQVEYATGSDYSGGVTHESNYQVLGEMLEEHHPEDSEPVVWARTSGGHGTYGIVVRFDELAEEVREALEGLEDYPLLDEEHQGSLEIEQQGEAWDNWAQDDFIKELAKQIDADPYDLKQLISSEQWWLVFEAAREEANEYWEDQGGSGQYIRVERVAKAAARFLLSHSHPKYSNDMQDDAIDALREALNRK